MSGERGFTIIEVMIAVLVLTVGLLGLASTAALVTRMVADGGRFTQAATLASRQIEIFRSQWPQTACAGAAGGSRTEGAHQLNWSVASLAAGRAMRVRLTVTTDTGRGLRTNTFESTIPCS